MIMILISSISFFACGEKDKYENMNIVVTTSDELVKDGDKDDSYVFTVNNSFYDNEFTLYIEVNGVDDDVIKSVTATPVDMGLISVKSKRYDHLNLTTIVFSVNAVSETLNSN